MWIFSIKMHNWNMQKWCKNKHWIHGFSKYIWPWILHPKRWCCESVALNMPANLENSTVATGLEKSVFIPIPKKGNAKECSHYLTIALISHTSKVKLKILQARLQQYMNHELTDIQAGFRKRRGTRNQIANIHWIFDCVDHNKLWKILQEMGIPDQLTCFLRNLYAG